MNQVINLADYRKLKQELKQGFPQNNKTFDATGLSESVNQEDELDALYREFYADPEEVYNFYNSPYD